MRKRENKNVMKKEIKYERKTLEKIKSKRRKSEKK